MTDIEYETVRFEAIHHPTKLCLHLQGQPRMASLVMDTAAAGRVVQRLDNTAS